MILTLTLVLGMVLAGCGNTSPWTVLHVRHLAQSRQFVVKGQRDANGRCIYNLSWMSPGTIEQDMAIDDVTCQLVAEVGPAVPISAGVQARTSHRTRCAVIDPRLTPGSGKGECNRKR